VDVGRHKIKGGFDVGEVLRYTEVLKEIPKSILAEKMRNADFLCDQCGAPMKIDWESHRVMFGDFEDREREMTCEYCGAVYKVNPHEFYAYYRSKS
jgi:uncharacterized Zn-finger protein